LSTIFLFFFKKNLLYPYDEKLKTELTQKYDDHVEVEDLNLNDIVKAFIGGQYV